MKKQVYISIEPEELQGLIESAIRKVIAEQDLSREAVETEKILSRKEVRDRFGLSYGTIHNLMNSGQLKYSKVGRKTFFKESDVLDLITSKKAGP